MSPANVQHFLLIYDITAGEATVDHFGTAHDEALAAYEAAEREHRDDSNVEVVLLGSDSRETLERTHSSYFRLMDKHIDQIVAKELEELGLR